MLSCTGTALKFRTIQLLHLSVHIILLSMQIMQVHENCIQLNTGRLSTHSRKLSILGTAEKCQKGSLKLSLIALQKCSYFGGSISYKAMCKRYCTHGKQSIMLCIYCKPFTRAIMASIPISCLFFQYHYQRLIQRRERHLCYVYCI